MTYFVFQAMFVATAATIVSGAVAERMKFNGYLIITIIATGIIYPMFVIGHGHQVICIILMLQDNYLQ